LLPNKHLKLKQIYATRPYWKFLYAAVISLLMRKQKKKKFTRKWQNYVKDLKGKHTAKSRSVYGT
jgi:hypothetical protein